MIERLEILVEEPSAEAALRELLPRFLKIDFEVHPHLGKSDLLAKLPNRLVGYARWLPDTWRIIVLVDCDGEECVPLKKRMEKIAQEAGLPTPARRKSGQYKVVNRIAVEELEAWYFGDWEAVCAAYPKVNTNVPAQSGYRDPDGIAGGTWEALERVMNRAGYMSGGLRKIEVARAVARLMEPERNASVSFKQFWRAVTTAL